MFKNIKFFMFFILCFCLYNIKVSAIVFPEGECHYSNFVFSPEIEEKISKGYAISIRKEVQESTKLNTTAILPPEHRS